MTQDEILSMLAGEDMDVMVSCDVMDFLWVHFQSSSGVWVNSLVNPADGDIPAFYSLGKKEGVDGFSRLNIPPYSTDIGAAMCVVERMYVGKTIGFQVIRWPSNSGSDWIVSFGNGQHGLYAADATTFSLAICRAALLATLPKMV